MVTYSKYVKEGRSLLKAHKLDYMKQKAIYFRSSSYSFSLQKLQAECWVTVAL